MNVLIYLVAAGVCGGLAVRAWAFEKQDPLVRAFAVVALLMALSFLGFSLYLVPGLADFRYLYSFVGAFLPAAMLTFFGRFFRGPAFRGPAAGGPAAGRPDPGRPDPGGISRGRVRTWWLVTVPVAVLFLVVDAGFYLDVPRASPAELGLGLFTLAGFLRVLWLLWTEHQRSEDHVTRVRIRYLLGLLAAAVFFTATEEISRGTVGGGPGGRGFLSRSMALQGALPPVGVLFGVLFTTFLYRVARRTRLLELHELFARLFTVAVGAVLLVLVAVLAELWVGDVWAHPAHGAFLFFLASAGFLASYDPLRARVELAAAEWFNRPGHRLDLTLVEVERGLAKVISLGGVERELIVRLQASGRAPLISLYLWDGERGAYRIELQRGTSERPVQQLIVGGALVRAIEAGCRACVRIDIEREDTPGAGDLLRVLDAMNADLVLPVLEGGFVQGWLALQADPWSDGFSSDEVRRLVGLVDRVAVVLENIQSRGAIEEQRRLAALGTMSAGLAHEIRNPLAGIKGAAQFLQGGGPDADPSETRDFLDVIIDEVNRLDLVVGQFLDYARPFEIRPQAVRPCTVARKVCDVVKAGGLPVRVELELTVEEGLPVIQADPDRLRQVLLNLLMNALHAVGEHGHVRVEVSRGLLSDPAHRGVSAVEFAVVDDGAGIEAADLEKLFIPFFTTRRDGTGLGLPISRRLVEAHGGEITVRSRPGRGSAFTVRLPVGEPTEG